VFFEFFVLQLCRKFLTIFRYFGCAQYSASLNNQIKKVKMKQQDNQPTMNENLKNRLQSQFPVSDAGGGDWCAFVPKEMIQSWENIYHMMSQARQELLKVAEGMKPIEN
jgi:hypothetical protein